MLIEGILFSKYDQRATRNKNRHSKQAYTMQEFSP